MYDLLYSVHHGHDNHVPGLLVQLVQKEGEWLPSEMCLLVPAQIRLVVCVARQVRALRPKKQTPNEPLYTGDPELPTKSDAAVSYLMDG